jgi:phosphate transport system substrate-binding protein
MQQSSLDADAVMTRTLARRLMTGLAAAAAAAATTAALSAPAAIAQSAAPPTVRIGGSSTVFPILQEAIRDFQADGRNRQVRIKLTESGTTGGMRQFCRGEIAIANASRPISSQELRACAARGVTFIELPIAFDAITVVVNPANTWARAISTAELSRLWRRSAEGTVTRWRKVNTTWPDRPIKLCGPGKDSGTFDYFNQAINGSPTNSRRDFTASEDDNVLVDCVARNPEALGYFGFGYYEANTSRLRALPVTGPKGTVAPSVANVQKGRYVPLARPLFLYVNDRALRDETELRRFLTHTLQRGLRFTEKAGFIPLPADTYRLVESKLYRHVLGTSFGGDLPVGLSIGEALRRSFDSTKRPAYR